MDTKEKIDSVVEKALGKEGDPNEVLSSLVKDSEYNEETIKRIAEDYNVKSFLTRQKKGEDMEADFPLANSTVIAMKALKDNLKKANHIEVLEEEYYPIGGIEKVASSITLIVERDYSPSNYLWSATPCKDRVMTECKAIEYNPIPLAMQKCAAYISSFPSYDTQLVSEFRYLCPDSAILKEAGLDLGKARMPDRMTNQHSDFLAIEKILEKLASAGLIKIAKNNEKKKKEPKLSQKAQESRKLQHESNINPKTGRPFNYTDIDKGILEGEKDVINALNNQALVDELGIPERLPNEDPKRYHQRKLDASKVRNEQRLKSIKDNIAKQKGTAKRQSAIDAETEAQELANYDTNLYKAKAETGKAMNVPYQKNRQQKIHTDISNELLNADLDSAEGYGNLEARKDYSELLRNLRARRGELVANDEKNKLVSEIQKYQAQVDPDSLLGNYNFAKDYIGNRLTPIEDLTNIGKSIQNTISPFTDVIRNQAGQMFLGRINNGSELFGPPDHDLVLEYSGNTHKLLNNMNIKNNFETLLENDPNLQGSDPYIMLDTYRSANDIAPTAMKNKEIARSVLRTANSLGTGGIDPETAALLSKLELQYGKLVQARSSGTPDYGRISLGYT